MQTRGSTPSLHAVRGRRPPRRWPRRSPRATRSRSRSSRRAATGARPGLYCYQPLTARLRRAPLGVAASAAGGAATRRSRSPRSAACDEYLDTYAAGAPRRRAAGDGRAALLRRTACFDGCAGDFELLPERFEPAYRELQAGRPPTERSELAVLALLRGHRLRVRRRSSSPRARCSCRSTRLEVLPPDPPGASRSGPATVVALLPRAGPGALEGVARPAARRADGAAAVRAGHRARAAGLDPRASAPPGGRCRSRAAGRGDGAGDRRGRPGGGAARVRRRSSRAGARSTGELAWALERFELGCERDDPLSGLSRPPAGAARAARARGAAQRPARRAHRRAVRAARARARGDRARSRARSRSSSPLIAGVARRRRRGRARGRDRAAPARAAARRDLRPPARRSSSSSPTRCCAEQVEPEPSGEVRVRRARPRPAPAPEDPFADRRLLRHRGRGLAARATRRSRGAPRDPRAARRGR